MEFRPGDYRTDTERTFRFGTESLEYSLIFPITCIETKYINESYIIQFYLCMFVKNPLLETHSDGKDFMLTSIPDKNLITSQI